MVHQRHLANAPAREALIDIQFEPEVPLEVLGRFASQASAKFGQSTELWEAQVDLVGGPEGASARTSHAVVGYRLDSADKLHVLQCRTRGFTFSRLAPYAQWDQLRDEADQWWNLFCEMVNPGIVTRLAVRYINAIDIPLPVQDFADYFVCAPKVPAGLPQALSGFLQRTVIPDELTKTVSIVTQALEDQGGIATTKITVLLDVDVFRQVAFDREKRGEVLAVLDVLRDQKNRMFFEHLTEKTIGMFE